MANNIFDEIEIRLSAVPRWTILHTIRKQSVAEHQYNVAKMAGNIARQWLSEIDPVVMVNIYEWALEHDKPEGLSGDLPTIVKDLFNENELANRYDDLLDISRSIPQYVVDIVKLADRIDAVLFLSMEVAMGNRTVRAILREIMDDTLKRAAALGVRDQFKDWYFDTFDTVTLLGGSPEYTSNSHDRRTK